MTCTELEGEPVDEEERLPVELHDAALQRARHDPAAWLRSVLGPGHVQRLLEDELRRVARLTYERWLGLATEPLVRHGVADDPCVQVGADHDWPSSIEYGEVCDPDEQAGARARKARGANRRKLELKDEPEPSKMRARMSAAPGPALLRQRAKTNGADPEHLD